MGGISVHFNLAVSIAIATTGRMPKRDLNRTSYHK